MISILSQVAVTLVAWFILMRVCTNLIGLLVRGFFTDPEMEKIVTAHEAIVKEYKSDQRRTNVIAFILIIMFLAALYYFWNMGLVIAAMMLMAARIPDLVWEIKHGKQLPFQDRTGPALYHLITAFAWIPLPVVWYALYRM